MKPVSTPLRAWILLLVLALIWGSSFILIKTGLSGLTAGEVGALRIVSASLFLLPIALAKIHKLRRRHLILLLAVGFFGSLLPAFLFAAAQTKLPSSIAGILNALTPLFTMLLGVLFFSQRLSLRTFIGLIIGLGGTAYLILVGSSDGLSGINLHALLVILATIFYGANLNLIKFKIQDLTARTITSVSLLMVGPLAAVYLFGMTDFVSHVTYSNLVPVMSVVVLGLVGTAVALILFNELVKITSPVFTSSVTYLIPIVAVGWGVLDGESLQPGHFIGMALIIAGVYLANRKPRKPVN
ncbi:DMT family transporter [Fulvivirga sedimenti]|jgi:drug/metabolite transporter (DMT)-like permease|uniref:DMT family transporter n=1 Tax=Fulvivirga sedimenti TaxID=2879465 RepID=A0A9X1L0W3_9BACT|nr:DMT family transporter [Fulvivirga sedimenti]MCA6078244.1 DMT family transporter [Fulvivirga sedimenti]